jgi:hypothetical protein
LFSAQERRKPLLTTGPEAQRQNIAGGQSGDGTDGSTATTGEITETDEAEEEESEGSAKRKSQVREKEKEDLHRIDFSQLKFDPAEFASLAMAI